MADIKPIETIYKGYRFRSRLEARWAVVFDEMNLKYEYEPQGYEMADGTKYLPDFNLPELSLDVEVKPNPDVPWSALKKMVKFVTSGVRKLLLILGSPGGDLQAFLLLSRRTCIPAEEHEAECADRPDANLADEYLSHVLEWGWVKFAALPDRDVPERSGWQLVYHKNPPTVESCLKAAMAAGKQARFEFGENGR